MSGMDLFSSVSKLRDDFDLDWDSARVVECILQYTMYGETSDLDGALWHLTRLINAADDSAVKNLTKNDSVDNIDM